MPHESRPTIERRLRSATGCIQENRTFSSGAFLKRPVALFDKVIAPNLIRTVFGRFRIVEVLDQMWECFTILIFRVNHPSDDEILKCGSRCPAFMLCEVAWFFFITGDSVMQRFGAGFCGVRHAYICVRGKNFVITAFQNFRNLDMCQSNEIAADLILTLIYVSNGQLRWARLLNPN